MGGGGVVGSTPLHALCRYVRSLKVWFLAVLGINRVLILTYFGHFGHK